MGYNGSSQYGATWLFVWNSREIVDMVNTKLNRSRSERSTPWLLATILAVQLLVMFTCSPVLADEPAQSDSPKSTQEFDCCKDMGNASKAEAKESNDNDDDSSTVKTEDAKASDTKLEIEKSKDLSTSTEAEPTIAVTEKEPSVSSSKVEEVSDKSNIESDKSKSECLVVNENKGEEAQKLESQELVSEETETSSIAPVEATEKSEETEKAQDEKASAIETSSDPVDKEKIAEAAKTKGEDSDSTVVKVVEEEDELAFLKEGFVEKEDFDVIYVDNDEEQIVEETIAYEELPTDEAKTRIKAGSKFPVVLVSNISSKTAKKGDVLQARLKYDLKIGPKLIAKKGSLVTGHIDYAMKARSVMHSMVSPKRWYRNSGCIGIMFDEIINGKGEHIALNARPARKDRIVKNKAEGRLLGVNHAGQITGPWGQQLKYKAVRVGLNAALAPAGVFSFGAMPVALGVMGAVNPSFAFMKPVGTNVPHRRIKGFCWGFLSGIPGSWIIEDTVTKGQEALIRPGDEFLVELHQEFTGKVLTEAQLLPGASGKVAGDVDDERLEKTKKRGIFKFKSKKTSKDKSTSKNEKK